MAVDPAVRDALALMAAELRGDVAGVAVLLDGCGDVRAVAGVLAGFAAEAVRLAGGRDVADGDLSELLGRHLLRAAGEAP